MLRADKISVEIGGARLLDDINVSFAPGRVTSIVGPNGA